MVAIPVAIIMSHFAALAIVLIMVDGPWWIPFVIFAVGILIVSIAGQFLVNVTVKH